MFWKVISHAFLKKVAPKDRKRKPEAVENSSPVITLYELFEYGVNLFEYNFIL